MQLPQASKTRCLEERRRRNNIGQRLSPWAQMKEKRRKGKRRERGQRNSECDKEEIPHIIDIASSSAHSETLAACEMIAATENVTKHGDTQNGGNTQLSKEAAIPALKTIAGRSGARGNAPTRTMEGK